MIHLKSSSNVGPKTEGVYFSKKKNATGLVLLMAEILHQLIDSLSMFIPLFARFYVYMYIYPRWLAGFPPSTVSLKINGSRDFNR